MEDANSTEGSRVLLNSSESFLSFNLIVLCRMVLSSVRGAHKDLSVRHEPVLIVFILEIPVIAAN